MRHWDDYRDRTDTNLDHDAELAEQLAQDEEYARQAVQERWA